MANFSPAIGEACILYGNKVLYVGKAGGESPYVFENEKGALKRYDSLEYFEKIDKKYEEISEICFKTVKVSNCETMSEAIKKLYDADMLKLPGDK